MGSDKKRKRKESESGLESAERPDKAERKRLKRLRKEKERAEREAASEVTEKKKLKEKKGEEVDAEGEGEQNVVNDGPGGNVSSSVKKKKTKRKDREEEDVTMAENGSSSVKKKKKKKKDKEASKGKELGVGQPDEKRIDWDLEAGAGKPSFISPLATPIVEDELKTKILKLLGAAAKGKAIRRGIREVAWSIRREDTGLCVLAADVHPIDVISHFPILCEDANIPYCYISGRSALGMASLTRRPTSVVMVSMKNAKDAVKDELQVVAREVKQLNGEM